MSSNEDLSTSVDSVDSNDLMHLLESLGLGRRNRHCEAAKGTINNLLATTESDSDDGDVVESHSITIKQQSSINSAIKTESTIEQAEIIDLMSDDDSSEEENWNIAATASTIKKNRAYIISDDDNDTDDDENDDDSIIAATSTKQNKTYIISDDDDDTEDNSESYYTIQARNKAIDTILTAPTRKSNFTKTRDSLARSLYIKYNQTVFDNKLPPSLEITWNKRLATTAGLTHYRRETSTTTGIRYFARIELSCKVIDDEHKLERTLMHEMCHAAAWLIDHVAKPPHGPVFKKWAQIAMNRYPHLDVSTCHQYEIFYAFRWQCASCNQIYGRHSNSIDVSKKVCGECRGKLIYLGKFKKDGDGSPVKQRAPSAFSQFVKENFTAMKAECDENTPAKEIMKKLSLKYEAEKQSSKSGDLDKKVNDYCSGLFERLQL